MKGEQIFLEAVERKSPADRAAYLERACEIQVKAQSTGQKIVIPSPEVCEYTARMRYSEEQHTASPGALEWKALMRKLDGEDSSYRN